ncbi:MAG TPA: hypothetical protein VNQ76_02920 [Planctomicrobium sp.]|nr:hypothetical protein [Planctomicrobium sp.]
MSTTTEETEFDELQRIEQIFQKQRDALNSEAEQVTERIRAWHKRRDAIDEALEKLKQRLSPVGENTKS